MKTTLRFLFAVFWVPTTITPLLAQWVQTNGPYGGTAACLAVSGTNLFVGTQGSGVFLSTNNGTSWTPVNSGLTGTYAHVLAASGTNLFGGTAFNALTSLYASLQRSWLPQNSCRLIDLVCPTFCLE